MNDFRLKIVANPTGGKLQHATAPCHACWQKHPDPTPATRPWKPRRTGESSILSIDPSFWKHSVTSESYFARVPAGQLTFASSSSQTSQPSTSVFVMPASTARGQWHLNQWKQARSSTLLSGAWNGQTISSPVLFPGPTLKAT